MGPIVPTLVTLSGSPRSVDTEESFLLIISGLGIGVLMEIDLSLLKLMIGLLSGVRPSGVTFSRIQEKRISGWVGWSLMVLVFVGLRC